jgi:ADP-ribosylglycohydrolase
MTDRHLYFKDKALGVIFGHALGGSVGILTKFKTKSSVDITYPYTDSVRSYDACDWSADTDIMILIMQCLLEHGDIQTSLSYKIANWSKSGLVDIGDSKCVGLRPFMKLITSDDDFVNNPSQVATKCWNMSNQKIAPNISLAYSSITGLLNSDNVYDTTVSISSITCADPRCTCSCIMQSQIINDITHNDSISVDNILAESIKKSRNYLNSGLVKHNIPSDNFAVYDSELSEWTRNAFEGKLSDLDLGNISRVDYVYKTLACSIYMLKIIRAAIDNRTVPSFKKIITKIASECGDADTNCAVAGSTIGAYLGYSKLPKDWLSALPHKDWLYDLSCKFIDQIYENDQTTLSEGSTAISDNSILDSLVADV